MKFVTSKDSNTKKPVAYLVQGTSMRYYAFLNKKTGYWHTLNEVGDGIVRYCRENFGTSSQEKILETYYEGDEITIKM